jgi:large subunit ribosomal protein L19
MHPKISAIEKAQLKADCPKFRAGDTVRVFVRILEEEKTRIQPYEGVVIARRGGSSRETFTVRRVSYGEGVERTFFLHSPFIEKILVVKEGVARRAKLYYLRKKIGKEARIEERFGESEPQAPGAPPIRSEASTPSSG